MGQQQNPASIQAARWKFWPRGRNKSSSVPQQQAKHPPSSTVVVARRSLKPSASQRLSGWTNEADKIVNHILGYLLAVTGLIAFIDVVGNGKAINTAPGLFWAWVIVQGLGVDFQILALLRRLPTLYEVNRRVFWANIVFLVLLCSMLIIIGAVFVQSIESPGGNIPAAMDALGIPHWGFVWLRSLLSALLLVIFGIDRALEVADHQWSEQGQDEQPQQPQPQQPQQLPPNAVTQEQLAVLFANWENNLVMRMQQAIVHEVTAEVRRLGPLAPPVSQNEQSLPQSQLREMFTEPSIPVVTIAPPTINLKSGAERPSQMLNFLQQTAQDQGDEIKSSSASASKPSHAAKTTTNAEQQPEEEEQHAVLTFPASATKLTLRQQQMYELLKQNPDLSVSDIERQTGFARGYVSEQRKKLLAQIAQEQEAHTVESAEQQEAFAASAGD